MKFFTMAKTNTKVTEVMKELSKDIQMGQITIFRSKVVQGILEKLEFNDLISLALKGFTGSVGIF